MNKALNRYRTRIKNVNKGRAAEQLEADETVERLKAANAELAQQRSSLEAALAGAQRQLHSGVRLQPLCMKAILNPAHSACLQA